MDCNTKFNMITDSIRRYLKELSNNISNEEDIIIYDNLMTLISDYKQKSILKIEKGSFDKKLKKVKALLNKNDFPEIVSIYALKSLQAEFVFQNNLVELYNTHFKEKETILISLDENRTRLLVSLEDNKNMMVEYRDKNANKNNTDKIKQTLNNNFFNIK